MMLVEYLLINILKAISLGFSIILFDSVMSYLGLGDLLFKIFVIWGLIFISNRTTNALNIYTKVKHYNDYQQEVSDIIQE